MKLPVADRKLLRAARFAVFLAASLFAVRAESASLPFEGLDDLRGPFDGTDARGGAFHLIPLGRVGDWPVAACWSSSHLGHSPLFGFGWRIPALESTFISLDERRWAFCQPDGYVRIFVQERDDVKNRLTGGKGFTADVNKDRVDVVADPGDGGVPSRFFFQDGKLVRMICEEGDFIIRYAGPRRIPERIVSGGKTLLKITLEKKKSPKVVFEFADRRRLVATLARVPVFTRPAEKTAPTAERRICLRTLDTGNGEPTLFTYAANDGEAVFSAGKKRWTWSPDTRFLTSHDGWTYTVGSPEKHGGLPAFERVHEDGSREVSSGGQETGRLFRLFTDGSSRERLFHLSGPFRYRPRLDRLTRLDGTCRETRYFYDHTDGRLIRRIVSDNESGREKRTDERFGDGGREKR